MKPELEEKLYEKYPNLYKQRFLSPTQSCMCWGIDCGDGWFDIIDELSAKLEPLGIEAVQVKQKFGGLRFYVEKGTEEIQDMIDAAEEKSYTICEACGTSGTVRGIVWITTLCDNCWNKIEETYVREDK